MIPLIGLMVGAYIITKMLSLVIDKPKETNIVTVVFAIATILISLYVIYSLLTSGSELAQRLKF